MRKLILCLLCLLLAMETACAGGLAGLSGGNALPELPDPEPLLTGGAVLYDVSFVLDDDTRATAYAYPMPESWDLFLREYASLCAAAGYTMEKSTQLGQPAWQVVSGGKSAWLIPAYRGGLLVVVDRAIPFAPIPTPEPTVTPRLTPEPTKRPSGGGSAPAGGGSTGGGHVEYVTVQTDCFACVGGVCDLCHGTGTYRMYGTSVSCSPICQTCDGLGWWITQEPVWVSD